MEQGKVNLSNLIVATPDKCWQPWLNHFYIKHSLHNLLSPHCTMLLWMDRNKGCPRNIFNMSWIFLIFESRITIKAYKMAILKIKIAKAFNKSILLSSHAQHFYIKYLHDIFSDMVGQIGPRIFTFSPSQMWWRQDQLREIILTLTSSVLWLHLHQLDLDNLLYNPALSISYFYGYHHSRHKKLY